MFQCKALTDFSNLSAPNKSKNHNLKVFYYWCLKNDWMQFSWGT